mmetsp:Transcript_35987/g.99175  ORF Transcript_35987/g.99175 Transcript_35987/m.99175 type:complete len:502 (-) Transcript_35987:242-1747(-)
MVELRLETLKGSTIPTDCFVSVRIGGKQQLSKLTDARTFRFPSGEYNIGKIEVFRRVGACTLDVSPASAGTRDVSINCIDHSFGNLGLRVALGGQASAQDMADEQEQAKAKKSNTAKLVKEYLVKHELEARLADAMQAVLKERPEFPTEFIASKLRESKPPTRVAPPAPIPKLVPFGGYYKQNFKLGGQPPGAYAKFPAAPRSEAKPPTKVLPEKPPFVFMQSVGTWLMPKTKTAQPAATAARFDDETIPKAPRFDLMPSVGTWLTPTRKTTEPVSTTPPFVLMPSVGTWLQSRPRDDHKTVPEASRFALMPSVGTWLAPLVVSKPSSLQPAHNGQTALEANSYARMASVGTWLSCRSTRFSGYASSWNFASMLPPSAMSVDERTEVERVVTAALLEMQGQFEGRYFPLQASQSYPACPGGMSTSDEASLAASNLLFEAAEASGRGIFATESRDVGVWLNADSHFRILAKDVGKLQCLGDTIVMVLRRDGYECKQGDVKAI